MATRIYPKMPSEIADYFAQMLDQLAVSYQPYQTFYTGTPASENYEAYLLSLLLDNWGGGGGGGASGFWNLTGNNGTVDGTSFIGTKDDIPFNVKINNQRAGRIHRQNRNTILGYQANDVGNAATDNVIIGHTAGVANIGGGNVIVGSQAFATATGAHDCVVLGWQAANAFNGTYITAIGSQALAVATGERNTAIGKASANTVTSGGDNVYIGMESGYDPTTPGNNSLTGSLNTCIGFRSVPGGNYDSVIALNGLGNGSNQFVVGGAFDSYASVHSWVTKARFIYDAAGTAEFDLFFRTSTPEGAQVGTRGSLALVDDGTNGRLYKKSSGTGNTGYEELTATGRLDLISYASLGGAILAEPMYGTWFQQTVNGALASQSAKFIAVYLTAPATITGVKWYQNTIGNYTAANYNGVGLYTYSGGTLTLVASSTNDGAIWQTFATNTIGNKAFSSTYVAVPGIYFIGLLYCNSAQTTAPAIGAMPNVLGTGIHTMDFTNSAKFIGVLAAQTALPTPQASSGLTASGAFLYAALY